jgi:hypothetical protein
MSLFRGGDGAVVRARGDAGGRELRRDCVRVLLGEGVDDAGLARVLILDEGSHVQHDCVRAVGLELDLVAQVLAVHGSAEEPRVAAHVQDLDDVVLHEQRRSRR